MAKSVRQIDSDRIAALDDGIRRLLAFEAYPSFDMLVKASRKLDALKATPYPAPPNPHPEKPER